MSWEDSDHARLQDLVKETARAADALERIAKAQERLTMIGVLENCSSMERAQEALDHLDSLIA